MQASINKCCDLVMKGGVTSGVVYPAAIKEIAKKFHLMGIGGTSAGAIAACGAAAAEYRRRNTGNFEGFEILEGTAQELSQEGRLESLFRPDRTTAKLFDMVRKLVEGRACWITKLHLYLKREKFSAILRENGYGLCSGLANGNSAMDKPVLTEWLADQIDKVAGKTDGPLTFRDLHNAPMPESIKDKIKGIKKRSIDLRLVTTCLTFGKPFEAPLYQNIFAFDPNEWSRIFPPRIIEHLVAEASVIDSPMLRRNGKMPLPRDGLSVIVAARMSLSFPGLFSMVPLWSPNFDKIGRPLERVWFSDGGITSNFPIHRFDSIYPSWPTLGINLQYTDKSGHVQRRRLRSTQGNIFIPQNRQEGRLGVWNYFALGGSALDDVLGFAKAIFASAQTWHDNAFLHLPSYRDRIAEIWLTEKEGGLNLNMKSEVIKVLIERGREAGQSLASRFADVSFDDPMSWEGHRWTRFRSGMAGMIESLNELKHTALDDTEGHLMLQKLLASQSAPPCYQFNPGPQHQAAKEALHKLLNCVKDIEQIANLTGASHPMEENSGPFFGGPRPRVDLGTRAPI